MLIARGGSRIIVAEVLRDIGEELRSDESYKDAIFAPVEVLGVQEITGGAAALEARLKTRPGRQWVVTREMNRIRRRFGELGIELK